MEDKEVYKSLTCCGHVASLLASGGFHGSRGDRTSKVIKVASSTVSLRRSMCVHCLPLSTVCGYNGVPRRYRTTNYLLNNLSAQHRAWSSYRPALRLSAILEMYGT